jgi:DNA/RNA-binding domain of Phe-tRNA-synthetase-like protein
LLAHTAGEWIMLFRITDAIFDEYPEALVGVVVAHAIDNRGEDPRIKHLLETQQAKVRQEFSGTAIEQHPCIAPWREAFKRFGAKPQKYYSSIESLVRRVVNGQDVPSINKLVDAYNALSLKHLVPVGGEDLGAVSGDVVLTIAGDDEAPIRLIGEQDERAPKRREVIYKDDVGAICRRWNWREAERTKLTEGKRDAILVIEELKREERGRVEAAVEEMVGLIKSSCGGSVRGTILEKSAPVTELR